jgi:hypothetical protein
MNMLDAFKEARRRDRHWYVRVVNTNFPGIELRLDEFGDWAAWRGKEKVEDFTLTLDDIQDDRWVVLYE